MNEFSGNDNQALKVLMIEDDHDFAKLIEVRLRQESVPVFEVHHCSDLRSGMEAAVSLEPDMILLDLELPDSRGQETFNRLHAHVPQIPVMISSSLADATMALQMVREGAQDYLLKGSVDLKVLPRMILCALERHRIQTELGRLSMHDELTRLYNRRGFLAFGVEHMKFARRVNRGLSLVFLDLDGLKQINDSIGHRQGDLALVKAADLLRNTFRASDILARIGGDEFGVIALEAPQDSADIIRRRIEDATARFNKTSGLPFQLSFSLGIVSFDASKYFCIEQMIFAADKELYKQKHEKKGSVQPGG